MLAQLPTHGAQACYLPTGPVTWPWPDTQYQPADHQAAGTAGSSNTCWQKVKCLQLAALTCHATQAAGGPSCARAQFRWHTAPATWQC